MDGTPTVATGLEFAAGTTPDCKHLVGKLFTPQQLLAAYREGRSSFRTHDLVLVTSESDASGCDVRTRATFLEELRKTMGRLAPRTLRALGINAKSAHQVVQLPKESDAFWLIVTRGQQIPIMVVLFTTPYQVQATSPMLA